MLLKNGVFCVVSACGSGEYRPDVRCEEIFLGSVRQLLVAACVVPSSPIFVTLMKEAPGSSETWVLTRAIRRNNPEDTILHSHRRENLKSNNNAAFWDMTTPYGCKNRRFGITYRLTLQGEIT
jgi:hypothetical protein